MAEHPWARRPFPIRSMARCPSPPSMVSPPLLSMAGAPSSSHSFSLAHLASRKSPSARAQDKPQALCCHLCSLARPGEQCAVDLLHSDHGRLGPTGVSPCYLLPMARHISSMAVHGSSALRPHPAASSPRPPVCNRWRLVLLGAHQGGCRSQLHGCFPNRSRCPDFPHGA
jgi:hypothetical protein|uniref:Uncharacterized protein n=1 Tax=Zea mays TaxID=4577 RepID=A0A804PV29_MAIZE